ncbi:chemotaxis protein CheW [Magnetococcales bacterium HHB-1]
MTTDKELNTLLEETNLVATEEAYEQETHESLMITSLTGHYFAIPCHDVREILPVSEIISVPGSSQDFLGVIDVRGEIESVINLHKVLGIQSTSNPPEQRILLGEYGEIRSGILVDSVEDIIQVDQSTIEEAMITMNQIVSEVATGQIAYHNAYAIILSLERIFLKLDARNQGRSAV